MRKWINLVEAVQLAEDVPIHFNAPWFREPLMSGLTVHQGSFFYRIGPLAGEFFHSSNSNIRNFSMAKSSGGIYFEPTWQRSWGSKVYKCALDMPNTLFTDDRRLVQHGNGVQLTDFVDGLAYASETGSIFEVVCLNPNMVKILDGNAAPPGADR